MCSPATGAAAGASGGVFPTLAVTSAITNMGSTFASTTAQGIESDFRKNRFESDARMAELRAEDALFRGKKDAARERRRTQKLIGSQRAALAAQGIDIEGGSALDVVSDTAESGALDELTIMNNARREAFGFESQALSSRSSAKFEEISKKTRRSATIATGGANFARDLTNIGRLTRKR